MFLVKVKKFWKSVSYYLIIKYSLTTIHGLGRGLAFRVGFKLNRYMQSLCGQGSVSDSLFVIGLEFLYTIFAMDISSEDLIISCICENLKKYRLVALKKLKKFDGII
jgi:hypothetical protein